MHRRDAGTTVRAVLAGIALVAAGAAAGSAHPPSDLMLILDASGSMWGQIDGENKIVIARRVLGQVVDGLGDDQVVGLVAYGHRREGDCDDIELVSPLAVLDRAALAKTIGGLNPKGKTPITKALDAAFAVIRDRKGATVILVSDGLETCGGDPCAAVRAAREAGIDLRLHVVGFDVAGEDLSSLECAAQAGGGLFLTADNASQLAAALDAAVAMPAAAATGALSLKAVADGRLHDVSVKIADAATGAHVTAARTYADPSTNPRLMPLPAGTYDVVVQALGLEGDVRRELRVTIRDGQTVDRVVDFSSGEVVIGVTRNGELSDALYRLYPAGSQRAAAQGRTYRSPTSNPAIVRITSGQYEVEVGAIEIEGRPAHRFARITVEPGGRVELEHDFATASLEIGVTRKGELVDAVVSVFDTGNAEVARARTYTSAKSNPTTFVLVPGTYRVEVAEIRGVTREVQVDLGAAEVVERTVDLGQ